MLGVGGPIGLLTSVVVFVSKQVGVVVDKFANGLRLLVLAIGFPPGQLVLVGAGVVLLVPGRRFAPGRRASIMMLHPPIWLRMVAVSSWPGFLK